MPAGMVPEIPFEEAQERTGAAGMLLHPAVTEFDCRLTDSPVAWAVA